VLGDPEKRKRYDTLGPDWQRFAQAGRELGRRPKALLSDRAKVHFGVAGPARGSPTFPHDLGDLGGRRIRRGGRVTRSISRTWAISGQFGEASAAGPDRGGDVETGIELSLEEAFRGTSRTISLELDEACAACSGAGPRQSQALPQSTARAGREGGVTSRSRSRRAWPRLTRARGGRGPGGAAGGRR